MSTSSIISKSVMIGAIWVMAFSAPAMDRFAALAQIESADKNHPLGDDFITGPDGELSRYQISAPVIAEFQMDAARLTNSIYALEQVKRVMQARCGTFESRRHRPPTDFEFYILWHRPSRLLAGSPPTTSSENDRAQRFANVCEEKP